MALNYEILHVEIKNNHVYVSLKIIKNGSVEIFNSVPIENIKLIVENFSFNPPRDQ
jgi:hypothetical protein